MDLIDALEQWYSSMCNGDRKHTFGLKISTLDNPGWTLDVDLQDTDLEDAPFDKVEIHRSADDWVACEVVKLHFIGYGGPHNLHELIQIFLEWDKQHATQ